MMPKHKNVVYISPPQNRRNVTITKKSSSGSPKKMGAYGGAIFYQLRLLSVVYKMKDSVQKIFL